MSEKSGKSGNGYPRVGVYICDCGVNIAGTVDVKAVVDDAAALPGVVLAREYKYICSEPGQELIRQDIQEQKLERVVVASCSPRTHEPLFQETIREAGLNRFLFEMANIRDQCSWVHMHEKEEATHKARDLVRMAIANARLIRPLDELTKSVTKKGLVVGGGLAGMSAALGLADQGFETFLVEREEELGGNLRLIQNTLDGKDVQEFLRDMRQRVTNDPRIQVFTGAAIKDFTGYVGNFKTTVGVGPEKTTRELEHGVIVIATGGQELKPKEYLHGEDPRVLTQLELERMLATAGKKASDLNEVVMIQCVGSRNEERPYCSRVCCASAVKNALKIKSLNPKARVKVLFRDMRMYGHLEEHYARARHAGVLFLRYEEDRKPVVNRKDGSLELSYYNPVLKEDMTLRPDLLVLSAAILPSETEELAGMLKCSRTTDGFFLEAHMKLRPVDFATDGIYLCGLAHAPKTIDESLSQAAAAVSRACTILSKDQIQVGGIVSVVDPDKCAACLTCVRACPYNVPVINAEGKAEIEMAKCQGCGICASECPGKAIKLQHFTDEQIMAKCAVLLDIPAEMLKGEAA